ncbi:MAG: tetratricopeptide repeat protein [Candidatus Omnitrophota bacterium]
MLLKVWVAIILVMTIVASTVFCAERIDVSQLEEQSEIYFSRDDYDGFIEYLNSIDITKENILAAYRNYYLALTYMKKIEYLDKREDWERFYKVKGKYCKEVSNLTIQFSSLSASEELIIDFLYLNWAIHEKAEYREYAAQAFTKLKKRLFDYAISTGDYKKLKEIADRIESEIGGNFSSKFFQKYIMQLVKVDDYNKVFAIIFSFSKERFEKSDFTASSFADEKLLELSQQIYDIDKQISLANSIAEKYLDRNEFYYYDSFYRQYLTLLLKKGKEEEFYNAVQKAIDVFDSSPTRNSQLARIYYSMLLNHTPKESVSFTVLYASARASLRSGEFEEAIGEFGEIIELFPSHKNIADCYFQIANAYFYLEKYEKAAENLSIIVEKFPETSIAEEALYLLGIAKIKEKKYSDALHNFENFLIIYPESVRNDKVMKKVMEIKK